ncbi:hypothetical protein ACHAW6_003421 [Cyclotella cf. meneghiniana]
MEMTKGKLRSTANSESETPLPPSPFTPVDERRELQLIMGASTLPPQPPQTISHASFVDNLQGFVATAVPVYSESFEENYPLPVATATALSSTSSHDIGIGSDSQSSGLKPKWYSPIEKEAELSSKDEDFIVVPLSINGQATSTRPDGRLLQNCTGNGPATHQQTTASLLRQAQHRGEVESEIEKTYDRFAQVTVDSMRHKTAMELKAANVKAALKAGRVDEGLTVDDSIHTKCVYEYSATREEQTGRDDSDFTPYGNTGADGKRGYEVAEYDTAEYSIAEYDVTEYKSVYD